VLKVKSETEHQADEWVHNKKNYNEAAVAIIAIVPDDGPMWPKPIVLE
jgi:hypothetical protein